MKTSRIVAVVAAAFAVLIGFGLTAAGGVLTWIAQTQQDADGFVRTPEESVSSGTAAITAGELVLREPATPGDWLPWPGEVTLGVRATPSDDRVPLFIGVARADDVRRYLAGVAHDRIEELHDRPFAVDYRRVPGAAQAAPPAEQDFWAASTEGGGTQSLEWDVRAGDWAVVLMNADGSPGVGATVSAGLRSPLLAPIAAGLLGVGGLVLLVAVVALVTGLFAGGGPSPAAGATPGGGAPPDALASVPAARDPAGRVYPAALTGVLDPGVSRGLWLVKWLLALPHVIVLGFLWVAAFVTTMVAGVVILFTGRYPRALFDFTVGVMRWTWRVSFYAFSAGGTDRYPPFTLARTDYPADFDVAYPERLSRGLVLVKWLLALPHLVIVGIFGAGMVFTLGWDERARMDGWPGWGGGVVGVLVLVALVVLLFTGAYPRQVFDLVMGMNRWNYRVWSYVGLLTDAYPPFRLDQGPFEPGPPLPAAVTDPPGSPAPEHLTTV